MNKPTYVGPCFCPNCGFGLTLIGMTIVMQRMKEGALHEEASPKPEKKTRSVPKLSRDNLIARVTELRAKGLGTTAISKEVGIAVPGVYYYLNQGKLKSVKAKSSRSETKKEAAA
jgi:carbonic anhydrase